LRAAEDARREARRDRGGRDAIIVNNNQSGGDRQRVDRFGHWHVIHFFLTVGSFGLWLPVWVIHFVVWSATR
jgi:hypothetical protein